MSNVRVKRFPDEQDLILIVMVLGLSFFVLRSGGWESERQPVLAPIGSSAAMDGLWRDAVRPLKAQDMRPQADADMIWDEPSYKRSFPKPKVLPAQKTEVQRDAPRPEPYFPKPRQVKKEVFKRPALSAQRVSFANSNSSARTKAFLKNPDKKKGY